MTKEFFLENGYVKVTGLLTAGELKKCQNIYKSAFENEEVRANRHDLGGHVGKMRDDIENMTQIMWPSDYYVRCLA